jgi:NAD(P)H dehydrogenase (quinone)
MNILIIYTHPNKTSLNHSFLEKTLEGLSSNKKSLNIETLDLYKENFNPVLYFDEKKRRRDMSTDPDTSRYRELLTWAEHLILIYPIWWGRPPAMLEGFFDRVFASGFAYDDSGFLPKGLLNISSATCISTMKGPGWYARLYLKNAHKTIMTRSVLNFVGIKKVKFLSFGNMESKNKRKGGTEQQKKLNFVKSYFKHAY